MAYLRKNASLECRSSGCNQFDSISAYHHQAIQESPKLDFGSEDGDITQVTIVEIRRMPSTINDCRNVRTTPAQVVRQSSNQQRLIVSGIIANVESHHTPK